jgi:GxxExxY protein
MGKMLQYEGNQSSRKLKYDDSDLLVGNEIVVELKSVQKLVKEHEVQLVNYLNGLRKEIGLLINFGPQGVEVKRKYCGPIEKGETF